MHRLFVILLSIPLGCGGGTTRRDEAPAAPAAQGEAPGNADKRSAAPQKATPRSAVGKTPLDATPPALDPEIVSLMEKEATGKGAAVKGAPVVEHEGAAPRERLAWGVTPPMKGRTFSMTVALTVRQGAITLATSKKALLAGDLTFKASRGGVTWRFRVTDASLKGQGAVTKLSSGAPVKAFELRNFLSRFERGVPSLKGLVRSFTLDPEGRLLTSGGVAPESMGWVAGTLTGEVSRALRRGVLVLPAKKVGVGARWRLKAEGGDSLYVLKGMTPHGISVQFREGAGSGTFSGCPGRRQGHLSWREGARITVSTRVLTLERSVTLSLGHLSKGARCFAN